MTTNLTALYGLNQSSGRWKSQTFTTSGIWQKPAGVEVVKVLLVGGGGSGGIFRNINGTNGGNSSFGSLLLARGGLGGLGGDYYYSPSGGTGGGVGTGFAALAATVLSQPAPPPGSDYSQWVTTSEPATVANGLKLGAMGFSSVFGSTGAGGGGDNSGGNVIGFGTGGTGIARTFGGFIVNGGGGGASYGNGGNGTAPIRNNNTKTWTNETATSGNLGGGGGGNWGSGGGGGEIVYRDVPVSSDQSVIIGVGGNAKTNTTNLENTSNLVLASGSGGNGICIVFWQE